MSDSEATATEVIKRVHDQLPISAQERWTESEIQTVAATVCQGLNTGELKMVLSIAAKYDLDPLLREIWGARGRNSDGSPGRLLVMVGRDGLLRNARRQPGYRGFDCDVVRANDLFKVHRRPDGERAIEHSYEGGTEARGAIVGAWAQVFQDGRSPVYYFAPFADYCPKDVKSGSSWKNTPSLMIQKCALSLCLRLAFNMSGVLGEEEADRALEGDGGRQGASLDDVLEQVPEAFRDRLRAAYETARELGGAVSVAGVQMRVAGRPEDAVAEAVEDLERYAAQLVEVRAGKDDPEPADAEVVEDERPEGDGLAPEEDAALRDRLAELTERKREIEENPGPEGETQAALDEVEAEIEQIRAALPAEPVPAGQEQLL